MEPKPLRDQTLTTIEEITKSSVQVVMATCPIHGPYKAFSCTLLSGTPYLGRCPKCMIDEQKKFEDEARAEYAQGGEHARTIMQRLLDAGVPDEDLHCTFASYDAMGDKGVQGVVNAFRRVANEDVLNLTVIGQTGRGKTHLAVATLNQIAYNDPDGKISMRYIRESRMLRDMKASFSDPSLKSEQQIIDELSRVDVLIVDEIGKASTSAYNATALEEIMDARYQKRRTIIIGNVTEAELKAHLTDGTISRLSQSQKSEKRILVTATDYRRRMQA